MVQRTGPKASQDSKGELSEQHEGGTHIFIAGLYKHMQQEKSQALLAHK